VPRARSVPAGLEQAMQELIDAERAVTIGAEL